MPETSKKFILTMRLKGKTVRCKGTMGEGTILENKKRELAQKAADEKERQQRSVMEGARKKDLESKNLPYYPLPYTKLKENFNNNWLTADEWYKNMLACIALNNSTKAQEALDNLKALKDEGVPFLIDFLGRQSTTQDRELALINLYACNIHPNDLPKIIECLNKSNNQISTRVMALNILSKSGNAKPYYGKIKSMTGDLLTNKNVKDVVKDYLNKINN
jgi:hypothetical protein